MGKKEMDGLLLQGYFFWGGNFNAFMAQVKGSSRAQGEVHAFQCLYGASKVWHYARNKDFLNVFQCLCGSSKVGAVQGQANEFPSISMPL